jgi:hypothetical protein
MAAIGAERVAMTTLLPAQIWQQRAVDQWRATRCFDCAIVAMPISVSVRPTKRRCARFFATRCATASAACPCASFRLRAKFRDEVRPRFGLMRAREFLMKDLYTCDIDAAAARHTYDQVVAAYARVFDRIGFAGHYRFALADTGQIGGDYSHELHVLAPVGEDELLHLRLVRLHRQRRARRGSRSAARRRCRRANSRSLSPRRRRRQASRCAALRRAAVQPTMLWRAAQQAGADRLGAARARHGARTAH